MFCVYIIVQNRQNSSTPLCTNNLNQSFSKLGIGSPITSKKVTPQSPEFIPANRTASVSSTSASPNFFNSYSGLAAGANIVPGYNRGLVESPHSGTVSPRITPQPSPPPHTLNNCSPTSFAPLEKPTVSATYQVGGT